MLSIEWLLDFVSLNFYSRKNHSPLFGTFSSMMRKTLELSSRIKSKHAGCLLLFSNSNSCVSALNPSFQEGRDSKSVVSGLQIECRGHYKADTVFCVLLARNMRALEHHSDMDTRFVSIEKEKKFVFIENTVCVKIENEEDF